LPRRGQEDSAQVNPRKSHPERCALKLKRRQIERTDNAKPRVSADHPANSFSPE
jgi:hypothetical protein